MSKVSEEVALESLRSFLGNHLKRDLAKGKLTDDYISEEYDMVLYAIMEGNLIFDDHNKPVYTLFEPIKNESGDVSVSSVKFRSRIKGADKTILVNGIDPKKQLGDYMLKVIAYMTQIEGGVGVIKKLDKEDYDTLNQLCSVF